MLSLKIFKALADETRLRMLHLLLSNELNVNEIVSLLDMGQSRISRHLKILSDSGLLTSRRDGLWVFYGATPRGKEFADFLKISVGQEKRFISDALLLSEYLKERNVESAKFFDSVAEDWEAMRRDIIGPAPLENLILTAAGKCRITADLGCGTGNLISSLKNNSERVLGVDHSQKMLEEAKRRFAGDSAVEFRIGEMEHLPLRDNEVDCAVMNLVLHHLLKPAEAIAEAARVLGKGGRFILADFESHNNEAMREKYGDRWLGFQQEELSGWLEKSGFKIADKKVLDLQKGMRAIIYSSIRL